MGIDRHEAAKRGQQAKPPKRHPFFAHEHRITDSPSWADMTFSARVLLVVIGRQLTVPNNNGRLIATFSFLQRFGFDSDRTITRGLKELIAHGFLFRTYTGGYQRGPSMFAVTWLPLADNLEGLSPNGFKSNAWRDWIPTETNNKKKSRTTKVRSSNRKNGGLNVGATDISAAKPEDIFADAVLVPVNGMKTPSRDYGAWVSRYPSGLAKHGPQFVAACPVAFIPAEANHAS